MEEFQVHLNRKHPRVTLELSAEYYAVETRLTGQAKALEDMNRPWPSATIVEGSSELASFQNIRLYRSQERSVRALDRISSMLAEEQKSDRYKNADGNARVIERDLPVFHVKDGDKPLTPTGNLIVCFAEGKKLEEVTAILADLAPRLQGIRQLHPAHPIFFGKLSYSNRREYLDAFRIAQELVREGAERGVELAYPELIAERDIREAHPDQWHLGGTCTIGGRVPPNTGILDAWKLGYTGKGVVIAVIDAGFDLGHPEFAAANGARKVVSPQHFPDGNQGKLSLPVESHGTWCAGVACARGLPGGASGVARDALLMPIALPKSKLSVASIEEAAAFFWAVDKGADVISCSWGATRRSLPYLPEHTETAFRHAATRGRKGKGCVIVFAAGNGRYDLREDPYAASPYAIAVGGATIGGIRWEMSAFGDNLFCCFPCICGTLATNGAGSLTNDIRTTDPRDTELVSFSGDYYNGFSETSAAAAGVAGVVAVVLQKYSNKTVDELRDQLKKGMIAIKPDRGTPSTQAGIHNPYTGYGWLNAQLSLS